LYSLHLRRLLFALPLPHTPTLFPTRRSSDLAPTAQRRARRRRSTLWRYPASGLIRSRPPFRLPVPHTRRSSPASTRPRTAFAATDRKSTRLNSSHESISYAVLRLTKKTPRTR